MSTNKRNRGKNMNRDKCPICAEDLAGSESDCCAVVTAGGWNYEEEPSVEEAPVEEAPVEEEDEVILEEEEAPEEVVEEEESDDDDEDLGAYLEELPVKELKKLCEEADLSKKGKKADLVARLLE